MKKTERITTEEKVLNAALKEFSQHGFYGARIDRIAKNAKVNKAMIYYHFKSKEALYERVFSDMVTNVYGHLSQINPSIDDSREKLYTILGNYISFLLSVDIGFVQFMLREISGGGKYFRKIALPTLVGPMSSIISQVFTQAVAEKKIKKMNPFFAFLPVIGGLIILNVLRLTLQGTEFFNRHFYNEFMNDYGKSLIDILKNGIELKEKDR